MTERKDEKMKKMKRKKRAKNEITMYVVRKVCK